MKEIELSVLIITVVCFVLFTVVANHNQVCRQSQPVVLPPPPGYLSSSIADRSGFGLPNCPWSLTVEPGRRIRLSIYNFVSSVINVGTRRGTCEPYLSILDQKQHTNITICRGDVRRKEVYVSGKNILQLHIPPAPKAASEPRRFLVSYEGEFNILRWSSLISVLLKYILQKENRDIPESVLIRDFFSSNLFHKIKAAN